MAGNELGLGITVSLKDMFSSKAKTVSGSMDNMSDKADKSVGGLNKLQGALTAIAGAAIFQQAKQMFTSLVEPAIAFEKQLMEISTLAEDGVGNIQGLSDAVVALSSKFGEDPAEQARAMFDVMQDGFINTADASKILESSLKLSQVGVISMGTATTAISTILKTYNMDAGKAAQVSEDLFVAAKQGKIGIGELTQFMQRALPIAENLGVGYEQVLAAFTGIAKTGVRPGLAMNTLTMAMTALTENARKLDPFFKKYGDGTLEATIANKGLMETLNAMFNASKDPKKLFEEMGIQGKTWQNLLKILGPEFANFSDSLGKINADTQTLQEAFAVLEGATGEKLNDLKSSTSLIAKEIGTKMLESINKVLDVVNPWVAKLREWLHENPRVAKTLGYVITALVVLAGALALVATAVGIVTAVTMIFEVVFSPIGLIIIAIVAGIAMIAYEAYQLYKTWQQIRPALQPVFDWLKKAWMVISADIIKAWNWLKESAVAIWGAIKEAVTSVATAISDWWSANVSPILDAAVSGFNVFKDIVVGVFDSIKTAINSAIDAVVSFLQKIPGVQTIMEFMSKTKDQAVTVGGKISDSIQSSGAGRLLSYTVPGIGGQNMTQDFKNYVDKRAAEIESTQKTNTQLSSVNNPNVGNAPVIQNTVNVPPANISAADIILDKKVLGKAIFDMQQSNAVRQ